MEGAKVNVQGKPEITGDKSKGGFLKQKAPTILVFLILIGIIPAILIGAILAPVNLAEGLKAKLGFKSTVAILEEQGEHVTSEMMSKGEIPSGYGTRLAAAGIEMGQINSIGQFVRTNTYIADIDNYTEVAAEGEYYIYGGEGELVARFNDEIITAENFVAKVEASPEMFAAYEAAADLSARYYHGSDVTAVLKDMGVSGSAFSKWENTGDSEKDAEQFEQMLGEVLNTSAERSMAGSYTYWKPITDPVTGEIIGYEAKDAEWDCKGSRTNWICSQTIDGSTTEENITGESAEVARRLVNYVAANSRRDNVTGATPEQNAAAILNAAVSADEPYQAASAFMAVLESVERAQISGDGPINEMMNTLSRETEVIYTDVNTNEKVTEKRSVLDTPNFAALVGDGPLSKLEANNFARDRILNSAGVSTGAIKDTDLSTNGQKKSGNGVVMRNNTEGDNEAASLANLDAVVSSFEMALTAKNSDLFASIVGANRIIEGGSFISNTVNQQVLTSLPSDAEQVAKYEKEAAEVIARQAEAERATKSPFDISSPYTFMGNLVRKVSSFVLSNYSSFDTSVAKTAASTVTGLARESVESLAGSAVADGSENDFLTMEGDCDTVPTAGAVCDLYGTAHTTSYTAHLDYTEEDWIGVLPKGTFESDGELSEDGYGAEVKAYVGARDATVGVKSYEVCDRYEESSGAGLLSLIKKLIAVITRAADLNARCTNVPEGVATGSDYVLKGGEETDAALMSGYALHDWVYSTLSEKESKMARLTRKMRGEDIAVSAEGAAENF